MHGSLFFCAKTIAFPVKKGIMDAEESKKLRPPHRTQTRNDLRTERSIVL